MTFFPLVRHAAARCEPLRPTVTLERSDLYVLHLQHMEMIGVRELQQRASAALRRVERGETLGVTDRGRLVAILAPPSSAGGVGALIAAGRVQPARSTATGLPEPVASRRRTDEVLDELRDDR